MNIHIVGAGPAGLYFAILAKKSFPDARIEVSERNRADDTFGFGIVLSDETLGNLQRADEPTYREIADAFAYWDDIYTQFRGTVSRSSGHGFSGIRRLTLLQILQRRAEALGVVVRYGVDDAGVGAHPDVDLLVAADGINSPIRDALKTSFAPEVDLRSNRFTWLGARMDLPGFTYSFREDTISPSDGPYKPGIFNMHAYQFTPMGRDDGSTGECTIVIETTDEAFRAAGLSPTDEAATARFVERLFADDLHGNTVLTNRSHWRQFPTVTCKTWHHAVPRPDGRTTHVVLLGDAAHTAHFSIGSGTKLALEDAIALDAAVVAARPAAPATCSARSRTTRRTPRRGRPHPALGERQPRVVRERASLLGDGADPVRLLAAVALEADHAREPAASRSGAGGRRRGLVERGRRARARRAAAGALRGPADVRAVPAARDGARRTA